MADILPINQEIPLHEKERLVKEHFESAYKIKFKDKLCAKDIQMLWMKMQKLKTEISDHFFRKPGIREKFFKKSGLSSVDNKNSPKDHSNRPTQKKT